MSTPSHPLSNIRPADILLFPPSPPMETRRSYFSSSSYRRLHRSPTRGRPRLGSRAWRVRVRPRLRLLRRALAAPVRILARIRDAYFRMMMRLASSAALGAGSGFGDYGGFAAKEYDEKVLVEFYSRLMSQGRVLVSTDKDGVPTARIVASSRFNGIVQSKLDGVPSLSY